MKLTTKTIFKNAIFFWMVMFSLMRPDTLVDWLGKIRILRLLQYYDLLLYCIIISLSAVSLFAKQRVPLADVSIYLIYRMVLTAIISNFVFGLSGDTSFYRFFKLLAIVLFFAYALKYYFSLTTYRVLWALTIIIYINLATIIAFPNGMYRTEADWQNYFLGYDNGHVTVLLPALYFALLVYENSEKRILPVITVVGVLLSVILCMSGTTVAGLTLFILFFFCIKFPKFGTYIFNKKTVLVVISVIFIFVVILRQQVWLQNIILNWLGKDVTFTGRTRLWDAAFQSIRSYPFFGVGDSAEINRSIFTLGFQSLAYSHNEILDVLVRSGASGFVLYICIITCTFKAMKNEKSDSNRYLLAALSSYWLMMMFESYSSYGYYYLYFVLLIVPRFQEFKSLENTRIMK